MMLPDFASRDGSPTSASNQRTANQIDTRFDDLDSGIADQYVNAALLTTKACLKHM
jgi:hypothetical protein